MKTLPAPDRDAPVVEAEDRAFLDLVELGEVLPELLAGGAVDREGAVVRGAVVEDAVEHDRAGLQALGDFTGLMDPGHLEFLDVVLVDLLERAVAPTAPVAVIAGPVLAGLVGRRDTGAKHQDGSDGDAGAPDDGSCAIGWVLGITGGLLSRIWNQRQDRPPGAGPVAWGGVAVRRESGPDYPCALRFRSGTSPDRWPPSRPAG